VFTFRFVYSVSEFRRLEGILMPVSLSPEWYCKNTNVNTELKGINLFPTEPIKNLSVCPLIIVSESRYKFI